MVNDVVNRLIIEQVYREDGNVDLYDHRVPMKAEGVCKAGIYDNVGEDGMDLVHFVDAELLEPMLITPEVLMFNGFKKVLACSEFPQYVLDDYYWEEYHYMNPESKHDVNDSDDDRIIVTQGDRPQRGVWYVIFPFGAHRFDIASRVTSVDEMQRAMREFARSSDTGHPNKMFDYVRDLANAFTAPEEKLQLHDKNPLLR